VIIQIGIDKKISIEDAMNFRKFKVACAVPEAQIGSITDADPKVVTFDDAKTAWVSISALKGWPSLKDDKAWQEGLAAMIKAATPHGWVSEEKQAIKAHVEWAQS